MLEKDLNNENKKEIKTDKNVENKDLASAIIDAFNSIKGKNDNTNRKTGDENFKIPATNQPIFTGTEERNTTSKNGIEDWLFTLERNLKINSVPNDLKVEVASTYLREHAINDYQSWERQQKNNITWEEFKERMLDRYLPANYIY